MKIQKILNNNVVVTLNKEGVEQVVCGRGIAYSRKPGDPIDESKINQVFVLQPEESRRFQEIIADIPLEYIELSEHLIAMIRSELGKKLSDTIYITLCDHLYAAIERAKNGIYMPNTMLFEIQHYYDNEYRIAKKCLDMIRDETGITLHDDEAGFITLHIVNAEVEGSQLEETIAVTGIVKEICSVVKYTLGIDFNVDSVYYYRFITHLKFFAHRVVYHTTYEGNDEEELLGMIREKYSRAYQCAQRIQAMMKKKYSYEISDEEMLYLTIHIHRIAEKGNI